MQETQVQSLGWEDLLEKRMATHCIILTCRIPWQATVHGVPKSQIRLSSGKVGTGSRWSVGEYPPGLQA